MPRANGNEDKKSIGFLRVVGGLTGFCFGIYLANLIAPLIISALIAAGVPYSAALLIGILAALWIIYVTIEFLGTGVFAKLINIISEGRERKILDENIVAKIWLILALLAAISLGIYLAVEIAPLIIAALMGAGIVQGLAVFTGIIASFALIGLTIALLAQPSFIYLHCVEIWEDFFENKEGIGRAAHAISIMLGLASMAVGAGLGIYLSTLVFPLIITSLTALSLSYGLAIFTALAVSIGLVSICFSLFSLLGKGLALLCSFKSTSAGSKSQRRDSSNHYSFDRPAADRNFQGQGYRLHSDAFVNTKCCADLPDEQGAAGRTERQELSAKTRKEDAGVEMGPPGGAPIAQPQGS